MHLDGKDAQRNECQVALKNLASEAKPMNLHM